MSRSAWLRLGLGLLSLAPVVVLYGVVAPRILPLPVHMALPEATLIDEEGHPFALSRTRGQVVVLSLIYTHCPDVCPLTTSKMKRIQERLRQEGLDRQVQLLSFTVDPERDRPEVLHRFAGGFEIDPSNWTFLTGAPDEVRRLMAGLGIYAARARLDGTLIPDSSLAGGAAGSEPYLVNHTDRLFLIDRQGRVRALSPGSQAEVDHVMRIIRRLIGSA